jgi:hypothetical protein
VPARSTSVLAPSRARRHAGGGRRRDRGPDTISQLRTRTHLGLVAL